jgi:membrane protein
MSGLPDVSGQPADRPDQPPRHQQADVKAHDRPGVRRRARRAAEWGKGKYAGSWAEYLWHRLDAVDFMNQAMLLAATLLLCAVPFLLIATALAGRSAVSGLTRRLGLNQQAAADVGHLFTSSSATSNAVTGLSWVFFVLGGIAAATAIQQLYQRVFGMDPRGPRDRLRAVVWLAVAVGWIALGGTAGPGFYHSSPVLWWIVNIPAFIGF